MRKYEDLSKEEKEKLADYRMHVMDWNIQRSVGLILTVAFLIPGFIMLMTNTIVLVIMGLVFVLEGALLVMLVSMDTYRTRKELLLVYGYYNVMDTLFEVKKSDRERVKNKIVVEENEE